MSPIHDQKRGIKLIKKRQICASSFSSRYKHYFHKGSVKQEHSFFRAVVRKYFKLEINLNMERLRRKKHSISFIHDILRCCNESFIENYFKGMSQILIVL